MITDTRKAELLNNMSKDEKAQMLSDLNIANPDKKEKELEIKISNADIEAWAASKNQK